MIKFKSYEDFLDKLEMYTGCQVYDQRTDATGVETPYIVCQRLGNEDIMADNMRWIKRDNVAVNLHTYQANHVLTGERAETESKVENYLESIGLVFDKDFDWLDEIELHRTTYGVEVWYE